MYMYVKIRSIQPRFNQLTVNWVNKIWCLCFLPQRLDFVDFATGSLGQGLSCACGMAYTGKYFDKARWNFILFDMIWHLFFWYMNYSFGIFWSKLKGLNGLLAKCQVFCISVKLRPLFIYLSIYFFWFAKKKYLLTDIQYHYKMLGKD